MSIIGFFVNPEKLAELPGAAGFLREAVEALRVRGVAVRVNAESARLLHVEELAEGEERIVETADALVAAGGDGTILRAARLTAPRGLPVLSVNLGGFGFLAELQPEELPEAVPRLLERTYTVEERMMLASWVRRGGEAVHRALALNDVVITKGGYARLMPIRAYVNHEHLATYLADGLIVATPTGSTAYSLSAGGPILSPTVRALLVTPICPHTLNARSVVLDASDVAILEVAEDVEDVWLTVDGQIGFPLRAGDRVEVREADERARLVRLRPPSFYDLLRRKFGWGGR
ncbi:MAG: NAD(+)/NADH kinase [Armatimonadota bacterium]|nr:NAD(+)/NADH kinase [Armatimonadota bacterium]MDR7602473.1 NAD(+)/NADH kinase [Armatimonadota bacterium]